MRRWGAETVRCARNRVRAVRTATGEVARRGRGRPSRAPRFARRRDGDIAPYRHAARAVRTQRGTGGVRTQRDTDHGTRAVLTQPYGN